MKIKKLYESVPNLTTEDIMPSQEDFDKLVEYQQFYESTKEDRKLNPDNYAPKPGNWNNWKAMPWAIGSKIGKSRDYPKYFKYLCVAMIINWPDLIDNFKRTAKTLQVSKEMIVSMFEFYWQPDIATFTTYYSNALNKLNSAKTESLVETIEKHDELNTKLFDGEILKSEVVEKINNIVEAFTNNLLENDIKLNIKDIVLIGSNVSYNYNKDSDLDIHIIADTETLKCPDNLYPALYSAYRSLFNKKFDIDFYGIPVEIFVDTEDTPTVSNGVYSVLNNTWIKHPDREAIPDIDQTAIDTEVARWEQRYNEIVGSNNLSTTESLTEDTVNNNAKTAIAALINDEWEAVAGYEDAVATLDEIGNFDDVIKVLSDISAEEEVHVGELQQCMDKVDSQVKNNIADGKNEASETLKSNELDEAFDNTEITKIDNFISDIYELRKNGLATDGEYSTGNLVFKELRNKGYLDNLKELKNKLISKELSLENLSKEPELEDNFEELEKEMDEAYQALTSKDLQQYRIEIQRLVHSQPIIQPNGIFEISNVEETDVNQKLSLLRRLNFIDEVNAFASGKYNFNRISFTKAPARYFTIRGKIKL